MRGRREGEEEGREIDWRVKVISDVERVIGQHHVFYFADDPEDMTEELVMDKIKKSSGTGDGLRSFSPHAMQAPTTIWAATPRATSRKQETSRRALSQPT